MNYMHSSCPICQRNVWRSREPHLFHCTEQCNCGMSQLYTVCITVQWINRLELLYRISLQKLFVGCDFAWIYITVHPVGVEETAGTVKPLIKIHFLRYCLNVTTYCVWREIKVKLNVHPANLLRFGTQFQSLRTGVLQVLVPLLQFIIQYIPNVSDSLPGRRETNLQDICARGSE